MINGKFCVGPQPTFIEWCIERKTGTNDYILGCNGSKQCTHTVARAQRKRRVNLYGFGADPDASVVVITKLVRKTVERVSGAAPAHTMIFMNENRGQKRFSV